MASSSIEEFSAYLGSPRSFDTARLQLDVHACGVVVVDNILDIVNGRELPTHFFSPENILESREEHQRMLNRWDLSLEMYQVATSFRSSSDIKIPETAKPFDPSQAETVAREDKVNLLLRESKIAPRSEAAVGANIARVPAETPISPASYYLISSNSSSSSANSYLSSSDSDAVGHFSQEIESGNNIVSTSEKPMSTSLSMATLVAQVTSHSAGSHPILNNSPRAKPEAKETKQVTTVSRFIDTIECDPSAPPNRKIGRHKW